MNKKINPSQTNALFPGNGDTSFLVKQQDYLSKGIPMASLIISPQPKPKPLSNAA